MKMNSSYSFFAPIIPLFILFPLAAQAETAEEIQQRFNEQILSQPFSVEDNAKLEAYMNEAQKKGIPPVATPSRFWRRGYTCADLRPYSWNDYRDCSYYYRFHGRYWPY